ncbi:methyltransferase domain-containing protein [Pleurocapsa sp. PCC 7319]|uniref:class I SAM-dependent methyltransferase n=1 Tax=Pleurocapsa sp. PCC 7319 TaxID=118161 RepID=UPI00034A6E7C|nr:methyltransferase domain-containing protein [Pleurocapsa sp. PCC 7319]
MWNPDDYAKNSGAQLRWAQGLTKNIELQNNESILDVGCGDGKITADFAVNYPSSKVLGIDNSPAMISYAVEKYPASQYPNLSFSCVDACSIDFDREFDLIFSNATLHWIENHQVFLKRANLALRDRGRLIISCGGEGNASEILQVFAELMTSKTWSMYFDNFYNPYFFYGIQNYKAWLQQSGFTVERLQLIPKDMTHEGKNGLAGWIRTTWMPLTERVPEDKRENFITQFVDLYLAKYPLDFERLTHVSMIRLEVDAFKV